MSIRNFFLKLIKGGPGSGCNGDNCGRKPTGRDKPRTPTGPSSPHRVPRSGVKPSELFPLGRLPGGDARTSNDPKPAPKPYRRPRR